MKLLEVIYVEYNCVLFLMTFLLFFYIQGVLESLERDLVSFFTDWPSSVYLSDQKNSFERMMLHALCQYLDLMSSSRYFMQPVVCCVRDCLVDGLAHLLMKSAFHHNIQLALSIF